MLYGMDTVTRYPDNRFQYQNLEILKNKTKACKMIMEMMGKDSWEPKSMRQSVIQPVKCIQFISD